MTGRADTAPRTDDERFAGLMGAWDDDRPLVRSMLVFAEGIERQWGYVGWAEMIRAWAHRIEREAAAPDAPAPREGWFDPVTGDGYAPDQTPTPEPIPTTEAYRAGFRDGEEWATRRAAPDAPAPPCPECERIGAPCVDHLLNTPIDGALLEQSIRATGKPGLKSDGWTIADHYNRNYAAAPAPQALDVERLAEAIGECCTLHFEKETWGDDEHNKPPCAEAIAAEYARLSRLPSEEER